MLELDLILLRFVDQHYEKLPSEQKSTFEKLLTRSDPELYHWLMSQGEPEDKSLAAMIKYILKT